MLTDLDELVLSVRNAQRQAQDARAPMRATPRRGQNVLVDGGAYPGPSMLPDLR
jgi:hypothetical protein